MKEWHDGIEDERAFYPEASLFLRSSLPASSAEGLSSKGLEEGAKLNQRWVTKHFVPNDQWRQLVQAIIYGAKEGDFEVYVWPCLVIGIRGRGGLCDSSPIHIEKEVL